MRIEEKMLILPALYIIKRSQNATTSDLIDELTNVFNPTGEDAEILEGRNDTKFSQKVRNLVSHRETNGMKEYTNFVKGIYTLTPDGDAYLKSRIDELSYLFSQKFDYKDTTSIAENIANKNKKIFVYNEDLAIEEGKISKKESKIRIRSKLLRDAAIDYYSKSGMLRCAVCGFSFEETYGELGRGYIEIHHEKPICEYDAEGKKDFLSNAVKNVKPLCANCHRMIHRNPLKPITIDELKMIIKPYSQK